MKVTEAHVLKMISEADTEEFTFWDKELVVSYKLKNGFTVSGRAACVDPINFNIEKGRAIAREDIISQLWMLEGYLLQNITKVAEAASNVNKVFSKHCGEESITDIPSTLSGIEYMRDNPGSTPESLHNAWMKSKLDDGWTFGSDKSVDKKTHPCLIPYSELPENQKLKDDLFMAVVQPFV